MPLRRRQKISKTAFARRLRKCMTPAEKFLWEHLRPRPKGIKFRTQEPILGWIIDFYCTTKSLAIEIDGGYHQTPCQIEKDRLRDAVLARHDIQTIRFTNEEVFRDIESVLDRIYSFPDRQRCRKHK